MSKQITLDNGNVVHSCYEYYSIRYDYLSSAAYATCITSQVQARLSAKHRGHSKVRPPWHMKVYVHPRGFSECMRGFMDLFNVTV